MTRTKIKICGITRPADAALCSFLGADYLGIIFAESPRRISIAQAKEIRDAAPRSVLVGVFAANGRAAEAAGGMELTAPDSAKDAGEIARTARDVGLDMIQLHGGEPAAFCRAVKERTGLPVIKAVSRSALATGEFSVGGFADYLLLDLDKGAPVTDEAMESLWIAAADAAREKREVFLAGGLNPWNVAQAVAHTAPFCVDVCRGVESAPGVKDPFRVKLFIEEVKRACP